MNSIDIDVIRTALDWQSRGHRVVMGTVVRTWGSAPRPPGSLMIIRDDGQVAGSVSGGCIEDDLIRRVAGGELALRLPDTTTYGQTAALVCPAVARCRWCWSRCRPIRNCANCWC